jgi:hypothetical protein
MPLLTLGYMMNFSPTIGGTDRRVFPARFEADEHTQAFPHTCEEAQVSIWQPPDRNACTTVCMADDS